LKKEIRQYIGKSNRVPNSSMAYGTSMMHHAATWSLDKERVDCIDQDPNTPHTPQHGATAVTSNELVVFRHDCHPQWLSIIDSPTSTSNIG
jgi:hypothetical protein